MNIIEQKAKDFKKVTSNLENITKEILQKLEFEIIVFNQKQLQEYGVNSDNEKIQPPYANRTIQYKKKKGAIYTFVTLYDEGDFQNAFYVKYSKEFFTIYSKDRKTSKLVSIYGRKIFGLTNLNIEELISLVRPLLLQELRKRL